MTVGDKLHKALGSLEQLSGEFRTFATETQDPMAKDMYFRCHKQLDEMVRDIKNRVNYVEGQEPQYKMESSIQSQYQQQAGRERPRY